MWILFFSNYLLALMFLIKYVVHKDCRAEQTERRPVK